jgi:glycine cleavage system H protein
LVPKDLRYTKDHEWVRLEDGKARVGITDHAQKSLGDIVYVELPTVGKTVKKGERTATVESVKAVGEVFAPLSGKVVAVNETVTKARTSSTKILTVRVGFSSSRSRITRRSKRSSLPRPTRSS